MKQPLKHAETEGDALVEALRAAAALRPDAAVVATDAAGRVVYWSAGAARAFGYAADEVNGSTVHLVRTPQSRPAATPEVAPLHGIVTRDAGMLRVLELVRNVAETNATVLVRGESGTGKELVARALHLESKRRDGPFVAVNCAAFTPTLLESELFGHTKGAFTGAIAARKGIFSLADGGTLFLDEVAELPLDLQAKLLRVLQERSFVPVGGTEPVRTDVRVIAATHRALREEARAGRFRSDLLYRLRVVPIFLPALRERRADIALLTEHFVDAHNAAGGRVIASIAPEVLAALEAYDWPGNIRELHNAIAYAFAVGRGPELRLVDLPADFQGASIPSPATREDVARVREALTAAGGDLDRAAALLGVSRTTFWRMRKRAGLG